MDSRQIRPCRDPIQRGAGRYRTQVAGIASRSELAGGESLKIKRARSHIEVRLDGLVRDIQYESDRQRSEQRQFLWS
jgi:hypothetical protein